MDDEELTSRIIKEGLSTRSLRMNFRNISPSKLQSRVSHLRRVSLDRSVSISATGPEARAELEGFKEQLARLYVRDSVLLVSCLRTSLGRRLQFAFEQIRLQKRDRRKDELPQTLAVLQRTKLLNQLNWALFKLRFQQKKKRDNELPSPGLPAKRPMPRKTELVARPRIQISPRHLLPELLNTAYNNNQRLVTHWSFHKLVEFSRVKKWKFEVPLRSMCLAMQKVLSVSFAKIRTYGHHNKKMMSVTLFQLEFKFKGLTAERIKHLNIQIEDLKNAKITLTKRQERALTQQSEALALVARQVEEIEAIVAGKQEIFNQLEAAEDKKRSRVVQDYYPFLKRLYCEYGSISVPYFKRGLIIKKNGINLAGLAEWPEVILQQNQKLKSQAQLYESQLVPDIPARVPSDSRRQQLEEELAGTLELVRGYIRDSYQYPILDKLQARFVDMEKDYDAIGVLLERGDISGLKVVFGMEE